MAEQENIVENQSTLGELVQKLGLASAEDCLLIGKKRGFPIGLKFITSEQSILLLLQIRHPFDSKATKQMRFDYDSEVQDLVSSGKLEVSIEDKIVWLTVQDAGAMIESGQAYRIAESLIETFEKAGLAGELEKCHYCRATKVESLTCQNGKVAQICDECLSGKKKSQATANTLSAEGFTKVISLGLVASCIGAVCWMLAWMGYNAIFGFFKTDKLEVPHILMAVAFVIVGFLVGGPVGFLLKRIPQRGDRVAGYAGIVCGILSIFLGEMLYVSWLIYKEYHVVSPSAAIQVLPELLRHESAGYLAIKIGAAFFSVGIAYQLARPKPAGLKL